MTDASALPVPVLLLSVGDGRLYPVAPPVLRVAHGTSKKALRESSIGSLIVFDDGTVARIREVHFVERYGRTLWSKALSVLSRAWAIDVELDTASVPPFPDVRVLLHAALERELRSDDPMLPRQSRPVGEILAEVAAAPSIAAILARIDLGPLEDRLDCL